MPDKDGFHTNTVEIHGRVYRWHFCLGADFDELVLDTPTSKEKHLRECKKRYATLKAKREAQNKRDAAKRLRSVNKLRKETH